MDEVFNIHVNLVNQLPGNIYFKDLNGVIFWHNNNVLEDFKRKIGIDNLIGKTVYDFFNIQSAEKCYQDDLKILNGSPDYVTVKQEKLSLINLEIQNYLTITKPIMNCNNEIIGIMVNAINQQEIQQILKFNNLNKNLINSKYIIKEMLIIINIMETIELNSNLKNLLMELKCCIKKLCKRLDQI